MITLTTIYGASYLFPHLHSRANPTLFSGFGDWHVRESLLVNPIVIILHWGTSSLNRNRVGQRLVDFPV